MRFFRLLAIGVVLLVLVGAILGMACAGARGEQGPQGPKGDTGANGVGVENIVNNGDGTFTVNLANGESYTTDNLTGPQGEQGIQGPQGLPGVGIAWQGEWSSTLTYSKHDGVGYQGSSYVSKQASNANHVPTDTAWWDLWVEKGDTGATGTDGAPGADGTDGEPGPNMIVAMGFIIGDGTVGRGYNVTSCSWNATQEYYEITLTGINYSTGGYVTLVTADALHAFGVYESSAGKLCVSIIGTSGNPTMSSFSFMVLDTSLA